MSQSLVLGFRVLEEVPSILCPLIEKVIACYQRHHPDLQAVYLVGSVAIGEWTPAISDIDVVGVVTRALTPEDENLRRQELLILDNYWGHIVSFINNSVLSLAILQAETPDMMTLGRARIIAVCGMHLWGEKIDFHQYFPTVETMARERTARARIIMDRYRAGTINGAFRKNPTLLIRSCAKAAIRVISSITILRGAVFYASPEKTFESVAKYAPETFPLAQQAIAIINGADIDLNEAISVTDSAIDLFYQLYPQYL